MRRPKVEEVPELMQQIQSRLPVKEAARTSVLSKSWLHAWSTIPTLRFDVRRGKSMKLVDVDRTLITYLRDNTPIERFELMIDIENEEAASHVEKWIGSVATKTCLKKLSLSMELSGATSVKLPDEILSGENLTKIRVSALGEKTHSVWMAMTTTRVINCVSLRELHLEGRVRISEEVLHGILSSCRLLVKIVLLCHWKGFKTIKVTNLPHLYQLQIALDARHPTALEISGVPNLGVFICDRDIRSWPPAHPPLPFNALPISIGSSVTGLMLGGLVTDNACLDMFKSGFPFLKSLTLHLTSWKLPSFHLTCASIKRLTLRFCPRSLIDVQVHAPGLIYFSLGSFTLPSLLFPVSSLEQLFVSLYLDRPVDANFFLKLREALTSSRKCYLHITIDNSYDMPRDIDMDDLRTRLLFPPATNVQQLLFGTRHDECLWERSPFFDAFFEICHPKNVFASSDPDFKHKNHFYRLMLREVLDKKTTATTHWPHNLKHVQIRQNHHQKWKALTNLHRSFLDGSAPGVFLEFKLKWHCTPIDAPSLVNS